jgi:hypothetical protein
MKHDMFHWNIDETCNFSRKTSEKHWKLYEKDRSLLENVAGILQVMAI